MFKETNRSRKILDWI